jgi:3D (Asp-Asp-Asp) domain-containing protein
MSKKGELLKAIAVLVLSVAVFVLANSNIRMRKETKELWFRHDIIREEIESLYKARYGLENDLQRLEEEGIKVNIEIEDIFPDAKETSMEVTAYAPLDPAAVEGMCYGGDPTVTASGEAPVPGETVAAELPFGTLVYIEGIGLRRVNDRGVPSGCIDVVTETRRQAIEIGRSRRKVIILSRRGRCEVYCQG